MESIEGKCAWLYMGNGNDDDDDDACMMDAKRWPPGMSQPLFLSVCFVLSVCTVQAKAVSLINVAVTLTHNSINQSINQPSWLCSKLSIAETLFFDWVYILHIKQHVLNLTVLAIFACYAFGKDAEEHEERIKNTVYVHVGVLQTVRMFSEHRVLLRHVTMSFSSIFGVYSLTNADRELTKAHSAALSVHENTI